MTDLKQPTKKEWLGVLQQELNMVIESVQRQIDNRKGMLGNQETWTPTSHKLQGKLEGLRHALELLEKEMGKQK